MARQMMHNTHSRNTVSYFAWMARYFAGFYWYAYFAPDTANRLNRHKRKTHFLPVASSGFVLQTEPLFILHFQHF